MEPPVTPPDRIWSRREDVWNAAKQFLAHLNRERNSPLHQAEPQNLLSDVLLLDAQIVLLGLEESVQPFIDMCAVLKEDVGDYITLIVQLREKGLPTNLDDSAARSLLAQTDDHLHNLFSALSALILEALPKRINEWFANREKLRTVCQERWVVPVVKLTTSDQLFAFSVAHRVLPVFSSFAAVFRFQPIPLRITPSQNAEGMAQAPLVDAPLGSNGHFLFENLTKDLKLSILHSLDVCTLFGLCSVSKSIQELSDAVLERVMFSHFTPRVMLEEWRLICSARVAELQLIKSCDRNKELYFMLEETKTETEALCDDIATILGALRVYDTDLGKIDQFWVTKLLEDVVKIKPSIEELRTEVRSMLPEGFPTNVCENQMSRYTSDVPPSKRYNRAFPPRKQQMPVSEAECDFGDIWRVQVESYIDYLLNWTAYADEVFAASKEELERNLTLNRKITEIVERYEKFCDAYHAAQKDWTNVITIVFRQFEYYNNLIYIIQDAHTYHGKSNSRLLSEIALLEKQVEEDNLVKTLLNELQPRLCRNQSCLDRLSILELLARAQQGFISLSIGKDERTLAWKTIKDKVESLRNSFPSPDWEDPRAGFVDSLTTPSQRRVYHQHHRSNEVNVRQLSELIHRIDASRKYLFLPVGPQPPIAPDSLDDLLADLAVREPERPKRLPRRWQGWVDPVDDLLADLVDPNYHHRRFSSLAQEGKRVPRRECVRGFKPIANDTIDDLLSEGLDRPVSFREHQIESYSYVD